MFADRTAASIYKNVNRGGVQEDQDAEVDDKGKQRVRKVLGQQESGINHESSGRSKPVEFEKRVLETTEENFVGGLQKK